MSSADLRSWSLTALAAIAGCFDPAYNSPRCDPTGACPSGFHCEETTCVAGDEGDVPPPETPPVIPDPEAGARSARTAMMMFASCMSVSLAEYHTTKAYQIATMSTQQSGSCLSCHGNGGSGICLSTTNSYMDMLAAWQQKVCFTGLFTPQLQPDLTYKIVAAETKLCNKGNEKANSLGTHPAFNCQQNNSTALNALKAFAALVQAKVDSNDPSCPTPPACAPPGP
jgi:hypothetical protein